MRKEKFYISTIAADDIAAAGRYGLGLEIAECCTVWNMDEHFLSDSPRQNRSQQKLL